MGDDGAGGAGPDDGQVTVEYVLLVAFIALVVAVAVFVLGSTVLEFMDRGVEMPWEGVPD